MQDILPHMAVLLLKIDIVYYVITLSGGTGRDERSLGALPPRSTVHALLHLHHTNTPLKVMFPAGKWVTLMKKPHSK